MIFVVYDENYKEIPKFIKLAQKYDAMAEFWALRYNPNSKMGKNFDEHSIINPKHKYHKNLIKTLKHRYITKYKDNVTLFPELKCLIED